VFELRRNGPSKPPCENIEAKKAEAKATILLLLRRRINKEARKSIRPFPETRKVVILASLVYLVRERPVKEGFYWPRSF